MMKVEDGMTLVAGVDSSTQSCKVVVRELESGAIVRSGRAPHPSGTEADPEAWWSALVTAIRDAGGLADVAAIAVAGQQHGMVVLDTDGRVIRPALLWNDTRSASAARELTEEVGADAFAARTGSVPVASFTLTKLRWLQDHEPRNAARVAAIALPHDWLTWRLRGYGPAGGSALGPRLEALSTDRSDASGTSYWNPATGRYELDLLARALRLPHSGGTAGLPILPRVLGPDAKAGTALAEISSDGTGHPRAPTALLVGAGMGDNAGAALGLAAHPGDVVISIGTSGTVFAVTDQHTHDASGTVAGFADAAGGFLPLVATLNAARVLERISGVLDVDHDTLAELALSAPAGANGVVLVPYFDGERTPNLPDATASLHGLTAVSTTRADLARAAVEGMLCGLADGLDAIRRLGVPARRLLLIGGAAQNPAVSRIAAQVFDVPVVVPEPGEYVAQGAAVQAAWALTGSRPAWPAHLAGAPAPDFRPGIRAAYARYASRVA